MVANPAGAAVPRSGWRHRGNVLVAGPGGDETCSPHRRVWLYITGVTDHHQNARPQSLQRLPGTDAWFWRTTLSPTWRGSYCFIPSDRDDDFSLRCSALMRPTARCYAKAGANCCRGR